MNRIVIRLEVIKYKKIFFLLFIFLNYLLNYIIRLNFYFIFRPIFKFYSIGHITKFYYNYDIKHYLNLRSKLC